MLRCGELLATALPVSVDVSVLVDLGVALVADLAADLEVDFLAVDLAGTLAAAALVSCFASITLAAPGVTTTDHAQMLLLSSTYDCPGCAFSYAAVS